MTTLYTFNHPVGVTILGSGFETAPTTLFPGQRTRRMASGTWTVAELLEIETLLAIYLRTKEGEVNDDG